MVSLPAQDVSGIRLDDAQLDRLFTGRGAFLRRLYRLGRLEGEGLAPEELHRAACCAGLLAEYAAGFSHTASPAAVASQWSVELLCVLLALPMAAAAAGLACELDQPRVLIDRGAPVAMTFASGTLQPLDSVPQEMQRLVSQRMAPLWRALAEAAGVAPRLLWSNTAAAIDTALDYFAMPNAAHERERLFGCSHGLDGEDNPLFNHLRRRPCGTVVRRVCCLHPQLEGGRPRCENCPLN